ncbi:Fructosamine kinase domain-containing protein [Trichoderma sp. SZMC 28013]
MAETFNSSIASGNQQMVDPDLHVLAALPDIAEVLEMVEYRKSIWAVAFCLKVFHKNGNRAKYFVKVSVGLHGKLALMGEFEHTSAIYKIFYDFLDGVPKPKLFCKQLALLHSSPPPPEGKFEFHCTTYNGNLPQDNTWCDSWETFFSNAGRNAELDGLMPALFDKIIPRLLRPLESEGRKIRPSLVYGDLWHRNTDELGNWHRERNGITKEHIEEYPIYMPASDPEEEFDDRIALYSVAIDEIRKLAQLCPEEYISNAT